MENSVSDLHQADQPSKERSLWQEAWRRFKKNRMAMAGLYFILFLVVTSLTTMAIDAATNGSFYNQHVIKQSLRLRLQKPAFSIPSALTSSGGTCC